jgi:phenylpropionate dioxygenase-like ring-hydroxylating dioxygenase large terminal subunit
MFLKNCWYVAALAGEVGREPLGRIFLNEPVVLFRTEKGEAVALEDRCSHRNYPLHKGKLAGDSLQCGYHGLVFDCAGNCIRIPGQSQIPERGGIRKYPLLERWGWVWIWMGEPALASESSLVDFHWLDDPAWGAKSELLHIKCDYRLIIDNLMDLSHLTFVHPGTIGSAANVEKAQVRNELTEHTATVTRWLIDIEPPPTYARAGFKGKIDRWQIIRFEPPAFVNLYAGAADTGTGAPQGRRQGGIGLRNLDAITPETETSSHYFWAIAQDRAPGDPAATESIFQEIHKTFLEDWEVLETQQGWNELTRGSPSINIQSDAAPIHARRILERLISEESRGHSRLKAS